MSLQLSRILRKRIFKKAKIREVADELVNPCRGWYQIHTFNLAEDISLEDREYTLNRTDTIAFLLIDISDYRDRPLDEKAIDNLRNIFTFFKDYRLDMIVRVVYDIEGRCLETEPRTEEQIIEHMQQLVPVMKEFKAFIFVYQGLLIGNWGEMHSSKFLTPSRLRRLADSFVNEVDFAYLSVRRPAYVRILFPEGEDVKQTKVGIFDDAILASTTHLGTFGEKPSNEARREQSWTPKEEIEYVSALCDRVPYGGEALFSADDDDITKIRESFSEMERYFAKLHVTYLNRIHDEKFINHLKNIHWTGRGLYRGMNGYDYFSRHLGYRFVLRDVSCERLANDKETLRWCITIENIGFARAFFPTICEMKAKDRYGNDQIIDLSEWIELDQIGAKSKRSFLCLTPLVYGDVYLDFAKKDTLRSIYFANKKMIDGGIASDVYIGRTRLKQK